MKIYKKIILILLFIMVLIMFTSNISMAVIDTSGYNPGSLTTDDTSKIASLTGTILATIRNVGIIASVVVLTIIGLKYMFGSLEEKANYKESMIPYIVGCFLLVGCTTIPSIVYEIVNEGKTQVIVETEKCPGCGTETGYTSDFVGPRMCPDCEQVW